VKSNTNTMKKKVLRPHGWILVLGMHRSGTSAISGSLASLGLELPCPEDRMEGRSDNPSHNESELLSVLNDHLLEMFGGTWSDPPVLPLGWERDPRLDRIVRVGVDLAAKAFPTERPVVWKDPRTCLLLPFWRRVLPRLRGAVLVWRSPRAVARSLQARDGLTIEAGSQLWERYNRDAVRNLHGLDVLGVNYDRVLAQPESFVDSATRWLDTLDPHLAPSGGWQRDRACHVIKRDLRHHLPDHDAIPEEHQHLWNQLIDTFEGHAVETPRTDIGRNEPCWCSSGYKFKRCHGAFQPTDH
jgi:hypothetical protein